MSALRFPGLSIPAEQKSISLDEFRRLQAEAAKCGKAKEKSTKNGNERSSKFNAVAIETEHGRFDSKMEYRRFLDLLLLERAGQIHNLRRQVSYPLKIGDTLVCTYVADFVYEENDQEVVEDAKGFRTRDYLLKKRLMKKVFNIDIFETGPNYKKKNKKRGSQ